MAWDTRGDQSTASELWQGVGVPQVCFGRLRKEGMVGFGWFGLDRPFVAWVAVGLASPDHDME